MGKELDKEITTLRNFRVATNGLKGELQMYIQTNSPGDNPSALIEITEVQLVLSKHEDEESYLVLRCM